jgi:hypothetical protein
MILAFILEEINPMIEVKMGIPARVTSDRLHDV